MTSWALAVILSPNIFSNRLTSSASLLVCETRDCFSFSKSSVCCFNRSSNLSNSLFKNSFSSTSRSLFVWNALLRALASFSSFFEEFKSELTSLVSKSLPFRNHRLHLCPNITHTIL